MSIKLMIDKTKSIMQSMIDKDREATLNSLGDWALLIQETVGNEQAWPVSDLKRFNGLIKYILLAIENNDMEFGINVIRNDLLPLLLRVMLHEKDGETDTLKGQIDEVTNDIKNQYTDFMYPNFWGGTIPDDFQKNTNTKTILSALFNLDYIQHVAFRKVIPVKKLDVLIAGCGTGESALACALCYPSANFTFIDISPASLRLTKRYAAELNVQNVKILQDDILTMDLGQRFDIIISTGVIHHLSIPAQGVENLNRHLKEWGALSAMVYGEYGRFEIGLFQEALKIILDNNVNFSKGIEVAKMLFTEVDPYNRMVNIAWKQDVFKGEQHIVDLLLNVNENRYSINRLNQMVNDGGMKVIGYFNKSTLNPDNYVKSPQAKELFHNLSLMERCSLAELINGKLTKHSFYAIKAENDFTPLSIDDAGSMGFILHKSPFLVERTVQRHKTKEHQLTIEYALLEEENIGDYQEVIIDEALKGLLELCDGKNTMGYIFNKLKGKINVTEAKKFLHDMIEKKMLFLHD